MPTGFQDCRAKGSRQRASNAVTKHHLRNLWSLTTATCMVSPTGCFSNGWDRYRCKESEDPGAESPNHLEEPPFHLPETNKWQKHPHPHTSHTSHMPWKGISMDMKPVEQFCHAAHGLQRAWRLTWRDFGWQGMTEKPRYCRFPLDLPTSFNTKYDGLLTRMSNHCLRMKSSLRHCSQLCWMRCRHLPKLWHPEIQFRSRLFFAPNPNSARPQASKDHFSTTKACICTEFPQSNASVTSVSYGFMIYKI